MKQKQKLLLWMLLLCILLPGCRQTQVTTPSTLDIASSIIISYRWKQGQLQRNYTNADKIDVILHFLHKITPKGRAEKDPELLQGNDCNITIHLAGGNMRIYRIKNGSYLSVDYQPWQAIDREQERIFFHLIHHIPSDQAVLSPLSAKNSIHRLMGCYSFQTF